MATCFGILAWKIPQTEVRLAGYSPWGHKESDTTKWLSTHTHTHTHTLFNEAPLSLSPPTLKFLQPHSLYYSVIRTDIWKLLYFHLDGCINMTCEFQIAGMWGVFSDGYFYVISYRRFLWCPHLIFDSVRMNGQFHACCQQTTPNRSSPAFLPWEGSFALNQCNQEMWKSSRS